MSDTMTVVVPKTREKQENKILPPYNVVLVNDDDHSFEYVIHMMRQVFGYQPERGMKIAQTVHEQGRAVVWTGQKEVGELKQEQVHAFGPDPLIPRCKGSMTAELEPAH